MSLKCTFFSFAVLTLLQETSSAQTPQWGTIKGQVVFDPEKVPERPFIAMAVPVAKVLSDELVVDPPSKGVRWVMVWLLDEKGGNKIPIHPDLKKPPEKVVIDNWDCMFEPHVLCLCAGQTLVIKNSAKIVINPIIISTDDNPQPGRVVPPRATLEFERWKASSQPVIVQCSIHRWMNAYVRVFDHPYFAVTNARGEFEIKNAPAGNFRIVVWQESVGWLVKDGEKRGKLGIPVEIKPNAVTDLGKIKLIP